MPPSTKFLMRASSHSSGDQVSWKDKTVPELKSQLKGLNLPSSGVKADLIRRLENHQSSLQSSHPLPSQKSKYFKTDIVEDSAQLKPPSETETSPSVPPEGNASPVVTPIKRTAPLKRKHVIETVNTDCAEKLMPSTPLSKKKSSPSVTPERIENSMNTPTKRKSPAKSPSASPRKRLKIEPGSLAPPENWEKIYKLVEELRSDRSAPVDTEGGEALPEKHLGPVVYRFQVLTALMLSSQTKDAVVGDTIRALQKHGLTVENINNTNHTVLNRLIARVGFHNNKTKFIKQAAEIIISQYNGDIPSTAEEMMKLPGVGPKMAYIIENIAFGSVTGIGVDTHMHRML